MLSPITAMGVLLALTLVLLAGCASRPTPATHPARPFAPHPTPDVVVSLPLVFAGGGWLQPLTPETEALVAAGERLVDDAQWSAALEVFLEADVLAPANSRIGELIFDTADHHEKALRAKFEALRADPRVSVGEAVVRLQRLEKELDVVSEWCGDVDGGLRHALKVYLKALARQPLGVARELIELVEDH